MVEVNTLDINENRYVCITMHLPRLTTRLIYCTRGILFDDCWNLDVVNQRCQVPVCIGKGKTFEQLLQNEVQQCSKQALRFGITETMKGNEALLWMMHED